MPDKYKATWVSHSSISDFLKCPRLYYLRNVYKDPITRNKITITNPSLALGQVVHDVLESLSFLPVENRFEEPLSKKLDISWEQIEGKKGGFSSLKQETEFKERAKRMLQKVEKNPQELANKAIKIKSDINLPNYWLSEKDGIILCGKIDWIEYLPNTDSVHIIDFKTNRLAQESPDSLQLPIYQLLTQNTQSRPVEKISYWYLEQNDSPSQVEMPNNKESFERVYDIAKRIKLSRSLEHFKCPNDGCKHCIPYEQILKGNAERVTQSSYQDVYVLS